MTEHGNFLTFSKKSAALCCATRIVSAVVTQPLHARQSFRLTFAVFCTDFLIRSGFTEPAVF